MLKKTYLSVGVVTVLGIVVAGIAQVMSTKNGESVVDLGENAANGVPYRAIDNEIVPLVPDKDAPLEMKVKTVRGAIYTTEDIPLDIVFHNRANEPVKLLNFFNNAAEKRVFFTVTLRDSHGSPFFIRGGGKIDIPRYASTYIELKKGEKTVVRINLSDYLSPITSLKAGVYSVSVLYGNQYGENCFRGTLESNSLSLSLSKL